MDRSSFEGNVNIAEETQSIPSAKDSCREASAKIGQTWERFIITERETAFKVSELFCNIPFLSFHEGTINHGRPLNHCQEFQPVPMQTVMHYRLSFITFKLL